MLTLPSLLAFFSCTDDGKDDSAPDDSATDSGTDPDPATVPLDGACASASDFGGFSVLEESTSSSVSGAVTDGVVPYTVHELLLADGDCQVLRRNNPFCDPACDPGFTCDFEGNCIDYPVNQDLGTVTIRGLSQPMSLEPVFPGNTYYDTEVDHPPFQGGDLITLEMPGGVYGPATLHGVGVEPLTVTDDQWIVESGVDLTVRWASPTASVVRSEVGLNLSIDQHGASPSAVYCTFADDGEGVVPGTIISELVDVGVTGFPSGKLDRRTIDSEPAGSGCMDFAVSSPRVVVVDVVGFTPCVSTDDCPKGQTCDLEFQICE